MKKKMSWVTIVLIIWLVIRIIATVYGLPADITLMNSAYSQVSSAGSFALGGSVIVLALFVVTLAGIYAHYKQEPAAPPIRWGPTAGFFAVLVDVVSGLVVAGIAANFISSTYYYDPSYASGLIAGLIGTIIWPIIADGITAALLYVEYKREGKTGQQAAQMVGRPSPTYARPLTRPSPTYARPLTRPSPTYARPLTRPSPTYARPLTRPSPIDAQPKLTFCTNCGTSVSPYAEYCKHCGKEIVN